MELRNRSAELTGLLIANSLFLMRKKTFDVHSSQSKGHCISVVKAPMENRGIDNSMREAASIVECTMACDTLRAAEPYIGMRFESEVVARAYYEDYAMQTGFSTRIQSSRKSEHDGSRIACRFGCTYKTYHKKSTAAGRKHRREMDCTAILSIKKDTGGKWIVHKFVQEHNHHLAVSLPKRGTTFDEKDRRIQDLTSELRVKKRQSAAYREQLLILTRDIEKHGDHLAEKISSIRNSLKELET